MCRNDSVKKPNTALRSLLAAVLASVLMLSLALPALAAKDAGANVTWEMKGSTLVISGNGAMRDFTENDTPPWYKYRNGIRAIVIEDGVTCVGAFAFYKYESVASVSLAKSVKSIGEYAFSDCTALEMISLGGVEIIEESAFARCSSLVCVRFPRSVKSIGDKAFYRCTALETVDIPNTVESLGNMIFTYCDHLIGATVQAKVESIPEGMFQGCVKLSEVVLGEDITGADYRAFYDCESFTSLYYPSGNENTLVEDIKESSIPTFADQNLRGDTPTDDELEGAHATIDNDVITQVSTSLLHRDGAIISVDTTTQSKFDETGFTVISSSVAIEALIDGDAGWDELLSRILNTLENGLSGDSTLYVLVRLQAGRNVPKSVLKELIGKKVQLDVLFDDGTYFGVDCSRLDLKGVGDADHSVSCTVTKDASLAEKHKDVLEGAETYTVSYDKDVSVNFSSGIFVGKENAYKVATIYVKNSKGELVRVQSAVVDKEGRATFYLESVKADTEIVLGVNVKGETVENAIIPDSVAVDDYGLLDRYKPIDYAITEEREFLGMNSWQFALVVFGVIALIVIVVAVVAVIIYRKKKLQLMQRLKKGGRK